MALQTLTQNEIEAVSGGCDAKCGEDFPIEVEAPGAFVGLNPLVLVGAVFDTVSGILSGVKHRLLACIA